MTAPKRTGRRGPRRFDELTDAGRARRLRRLALHALEQWGLAEARVTLLNHDNNTVFRVRDERFDGVVRVARPRQVHAWDAESAWLTHLRAVLPVAAPLEEGWIDVDGVPEARWTSLFPWLPGPLLVDHLTASSATQLGGLLALLHAHQPRIDAPPMRQVFHFGGACRFESEPDLVEHRDELLATTERIQAVYDELYADSPRPRLVHADLHAWNVKKTRAGLVPFDFEEMRCGLPVQDVAIALYYLVAASPDPTLGPALLEGYASETGDRFDPGLLASLRAGHALALLNAMLELDDPAYLRRRPELIAKLMRKVRSERDG